MFVLSYLFLGFFIFIDLFNLFIFIMGKSYNYVSENEVNISGAVSFIATVCYYVFGEP